MANISKTNVARLLDKAKIEYSLIPYEVDESDLGAQHIADQLGENIRQVFKTLVLHGDRNGYFVCVVPGDDEVDLKKAAHLFPSVHQFRRITHAAVTLRVRNQGRIAGVNHAL